MATFAKAISNGFALGAVAGRREIMEVALDSFISSVYWAEATGLAAGRATPLAPHPPIGKREAGHRGW